MRRGSVVGRAEIYLSLVDVAAARGCPAPFSRAEQAVKRANLKNGAGRPTNGGLTARIFLAESISFPTRERRAIEE